VVPSSRIGEVTVVLLNGWRLSCGALVKDSFHNLLQALVRPLADDYGAALFELRMCREMSQ
jgi:hypothetical protein